MSNVQLSSLRVSADMDASKYAAGAQQKVAADAAMVASSKAVGAAASATDTRISQSGDVLSRLSRQYVEGFSASQKFNSAINQLAKGVDTGKIAITQTGPILDGIYKKFGQTADASAFVTKGQNQLALAVTAANARFVAARKPLDDVGNSAKLTSNQMLNLSRQGNDVVTMFALGAAPMQIFASQAGQIFDALESGPAGALGSLKAIGSGLLSFVASPLGMVAVATTAAVAGLAAYATFGKEHVKSLDEVIKAHSETLRLLKAQYGDLGEAVKSVGTIGGASFTDASARDSSSITNALIRQKMSPFMTELSGGGILPSWLGGGSGSVDQLKNLTQAQKPFADAIKQLFDDIRHGDPDLNKFDASLQAIAQSLAATSDDPRALQSISDGLSAIGHSVFDVDSKFTPFMAQIDRLKVEGAAGISRFNAEVAAIGQTNGMQKLADEAILAGKEIVNLAEQAAELEKILARIDRENTRPGLSDRRSLGGYVAGRDKAQGLQDEQFAADQQLARARTNAEKLAAIEAQVRAKAAEEGDKGGGLQSRVNRALEAERNRQANEARDAQLERGRALDKTLASQQLDLTLIGKTAGETARLRMEFEQIAAVREEAALKGVSADEQEIERIKQKAAEYGKFADEIARANLARDLGFERDQLFRSSGDQAIASRQQGAGLAVDLNSPQAQEMRRTAQLTELKSASQAFVSTFASTLQSNGGNIGKAFGAALLAGLQGYEQKAIEQLGDMLFKVLSGALGLNGTGGSSVAATGAGLIGAVLGGGANDNYAPGAVTRAALPAVGSISASATGDIAAYIKAAALARNIDPDVALRVAKSEGLGPGIWQSNYVKNGFREPSFGPFQLLKGGKGTGFPTGLGNQFMAQTGLDPSNPANVQPGIDFALDHAAKNGWGDWYGAKAAGIGNMQGLAGAAPIGIGNAASKATAALDKMSNSALDAGKNLTSSITDIGKSLTTGGVDGKGGLASILDSLKPSNFQANTTLSDILGAGSSAPAQSSGGGILGTLLGFLPKLFGFADGTESAPEGWAWVGERGPELRKLRAGDTIRSNARSMQMTYSNSNARQNVELHVHVSGGSGDDHIRKLASQGAQEAISQYHQGQVSGGFGDTQRRYTSQKG